MEKMPPPSSQIKRTGRRPKDKQGDKGQREKAPRGKKEWMQKGPLGGEYPRSDARMLAAEGAGGCRWKRDAVAGWRLTEGVVARWQQIVNTKPETQLIETTRPLYSVHQPVSYSSRLQVIHRVGSGNYDRLRLMQYVRAWLPRRGKPQSFRHGF